MKYLGNLLILATLLANLSFTGGMLLTAYSPYIRPTVHPVESCMGLAFPIFAFINGVCLFFWLTIRKYRLSLLPLAGFLCCYPQIRASLPVNLRAGTPPEDCIKCLSYNIMGFNGATKGENGNSILNYLRESDADILCLQEYSVSTSSRFLTQKDVSEALASYPYHSICTIGDKPGGNNRIACYSRLPILSSRPVRYASQYNGSIVYEVKWGEDTLMLVNNHLESNKLTKEDKNIYEEMLKDPEKEKVKSGMRHLLSKLAEASAIRAPQADSIAQAIRTSRHPYTIVCGDFNDAPISYAHRVIADGLDDAFTQSGQGAGISYNQNKFYFRIDNILISRNLKSYNCTVDRNIKESDHYPIQCYIAKRKT